ncbi:MAG TPA: proline racemase family protein [Lacipirellulaceae bacterium]
MANSTAGSIRVIDSHTGGEPTRVVIDGAPDLGGGNMAARRERMRESCDWLRTSLVTEPRGSEWMVGAVLQKPVSPHAAAGVIFFNNVGYLGMCGHGLIGVAATLAYLEKIEHGRHIFETPVGDVTVELREDGAVSFENVPSFRRVKGASVMLPDGRDVVGDVAWGGNWFFFTNTDRQMTLDDVPELTRFTMQIRRALEQSGITGNDGATIDHIELVGPPADPAVADARNFVLCPGGEYDRSPCGTGTSAKAACLAADGKLAPGQVWRQESIVGSIFEASYRPVEGGILPTITGRAFVNGDLRLVIDARDPFRFGIPASTSG